jgi:hypothetical protein
MNDRNNEDASFQQREAELNQKERELRLRELELEITRQHIPLSKTHKHHQENNLLQTWRKKITKYTKFIVFVIGGIALAKVGFMLGLLLTKIIVVLIFGVIGYKLFLDGKD